MTYQKKFWLTAILAFGVAAGFAIVLGSSLPLMGGVENPDIVLPLAFVGVAGVFICVWLWWNSTDDVQQQGQMISWWWGGTTGALLMLVTLVVMTGRHSELSLGAGYLFVAQFAGMGVVWLAWKWRGIGKTE